MDAIDRFVKEVEKSRQDIERLNKEIEEEKEKKEKQSADHKDFFEKRENLSKHISELDKEVYRLNSQKEALEEKAENKESYMWNEYEITYRKAFELKSDDFNDKSSIRENIARIRREMKSLGDVNINAEVGMRKQFKEKFEEIKVEFDNVFKELFGGGKGTIELTEADDILDAGINIISQPPGKKLQNMMQLSGGEKALTAISLLFAIQNLKPSPFCLLLENSLTK